MDGYLNWCIFSDSRRCTCIYEKSQFTAVSYNWSHQAMCAKRVIKSFTESKHSNPPWRYKNQPYRRLLRRKCAQRCWCDIAANHPVQPLATTDIYGPFYWKMTSPTKVLSIHNTKHISSYLWKNHIKSLASKMKLWDLPVVFPWRHISSDSAATFCWQDQL